MNRKNIKSSELAQLFSEEYKCQFFTSPGDEDSYFSFESFGRLETIKIGSRKCLELLRSFCRNRGLLVGGKDFYSNTMDELDSMANEHVKIKTAHIRYFHDVENKNLVVDLNDMKGNIVIINPNSVEVVRNKNVNFYRPHGMLELPIPNVIEKNEFMKKFSRIINTASDSDKYLILAALINYMLRDSESFPILVIEGQQGTGKTSFCKNIRTLYDPFRPLLNSPPFGIDDLMANAANSIILVFDNISYLSGAMADSFCRISTGAGITNRKFHTNFESISKDIKLPIIINGISEPTSRPDFIERAIYINLKPLSSETRESGEKFMNEFNKNLPSLIGGLYNIVSKVLAILPSIRHNNLSRMTSFSRIGLALEKVFADDDINFMQILKKNTNDKNESNFWNDEVCTQIFEKLQFNSDALCGLTCKEIYKDLWRGRKPISFASFVSNLKRLEPVLKENGIIVERHQRSSTVRLMSIYFSDEKLARVQQMNDDRQGDDFYVETDL